jgi:hypothetical protein
MRKKFQGKKSFEDMGLVLLVLSVYAIIRVLIDAHKDV